MWKWFNDGISWILHSFGYDRAPFGFEAAHRLTAFGLHGLLTDFSDYSEEAEVVRDPSRLLHREITDKIIRGYYHVFDALPYGIPESAFRRAMHIALKDMGLSFETEVDLSVYFRGQLVGKYRADLFVEKKVIVEIKTAPRIVEAHTDQLFGYLKISQLEVGLVLNFGPKVEFERYHRTSRITVPNPSLSSVAAELADAAVPSEKSGVSVKSKGSWSVKRPTPFSALYRNLVVPDKPSERVHFRPYAAE